MTILSHFVSFGSGDEILFQQAKKAKTDALNSHVAHKYLKAVWNVWQITQKMFNSLNAFDKFALIKHNYSANAALAVKR